MPEPDDDEERTRLIRRPTARASEPNAGLTAVTRMLQPTEDETEMTKLVGPPRRATRGEGLAAEEGGEQDPVVGWLVVVAGPGRGQARRVGYGQNSVGRDKSERISLDFGDASISRSKHCFILYDPRKRQFLLRPGDGTNLAYLNGDVLAESRVLANGATIELGETKLRFTAFCGPDFDWQDNAAAASKP